MWSHEHPATSDHVYTGKPCLSDAYRDGNPVRDGHACCYPGTSGHAYPFAVRQLDAHLWLSGAIA